VVIIGAGHAGLAMSRRLAERGIDHVVLERGEIAHTWRTERWDSLRLLTPNWLTRLPGGGYQGDDPDGFMGAEAVAGFIAGYAKSIAAPVETHTLVTSALAEESGYRIETTTGVWRCRCLVLASGACNIPVVPDVAAQLPPKLFAIDAQTYRRPAQLPEGPCLVVGASATGVQLATEIHAAGRSVILSVGQHIRSPRVYRGRDILWWMDACGVQNERFDEIDDINRVRQLPSLQLFGSDTGDMLDLNALKATGVRLVGRLQAIRDGVALFSGSLRNQVMLSDLKMNRLLDTIDAWAAETGLDWSVPAPHRFEPTRLPDRLTLSMDLWAEGVRSVVWATGYRPDFSWLKVPVFDRKGRIRHNGGVVDAPGLYLMGHPFLRRRKSTLIDGAGDDAAELAAHLAAYLDGLGAWP